MSLQTTTPTDKPGNRHHTGFKRDRSDHRDIVRVYGAGEIPSTDDHPMIDLRKYVSRVYEQNGLGCCAATVICSAYQLELNRQAEKNGHAFYNYDSSRLFLYYNSRVYENYTGDDEGASYRDTLKAAQEWGICHESKWPYDISKFADKPPQACYDDAIGNRVCKYESIKQDIHQLRACLKAGFPFAFGFLVYDSFEKYILNGLVPTPSANEIKSNKNPEGHGVLAVGYDDATDWITVLNSWGDRFGDKGYFYMPYSYITNPRLAFDFWKINEVCYEQSA